MMNDEFMGMSETPQPPPEPSPEGVSLDELTEAYAQVLGSEARSGPENEPAVSEGEPATAAQPDGERPEPESQSSDDDPCEISPRTIFEAMLFVGNRDGQPLSADRAAELMRGVEPEEITPLVDQLNRDYAANGRPFHVVSEGSGYRLTLRKVYHPLRNRFYGRVREARLSQAAIDVLAVVAYQQPLTGDEISRMRGKPSSHVLSQLVRRGLLRIERRDPKRRVASYFTTDRFLELFGLKSLEELPQSEDLDRQ